MRRCGQESEAVRISSGRATENDVGLATRAPMTSSPVSEPAPSGQPREPIPFGSILKDTVAPRTWWLYVFHLAALLKALWFWVGALRAHTGADLTVLSLYRPPLPSNDIQ